MANKPVRGARQPRSHPRCGLVLVPLKPRYGLIIIIMVPVLVPRSRVVAEMKPYAWADVHGYAGTTVPWPIASVVVLNVTTARSVARCNTCRVRSHAQLR